MFPTSLFRYYDEVWMSPEEACLDALCFDHSDLDEH